jgi:sulfhydrogenase subunit alpha
LGDRLKGDAKKSYKKLANKRWARNPLYNNFAQGVEMVYSLEGIVSTVDKLLGQEPPKVAKPTKQSGSGAGGVEAPRGTLIHRYDIKDGKIVAADIITPTAMFLDDIEAFIRKGGDDLLAKGQKQNLELQFEMVARAYDPCISCSAHLVSVEYK